MGYNLLASDSYAIINQSVMTELDKKILISLYEPIIGYSAIGLYLTLISDLDRLEIMSLNYTHHHLMTIMKSDLNTIEKSRKALEALGLLKTYVKKNQNSNEYLYELYSPLSPYEFFNNSILSTLLKNNIGETEYNNLVKYYRKPKFDLSEYEEITSKLNETFTSVSSIEANNEELKKQTKLGISIDNLIDFDLIIESIPSGLINAKTFNKRMRELINQLAFVYNIDTLKMCDILRLVISENGVISKDKLKEAVRKSYEFNNNGSKPTIVYKTQPDYLKTKNSETSPSSKMIYIFENTKPYDFLRSKNKGVNPIKKELDILNHLAEDFKLPPGVINVLIDYEIKINDGRIVQNHIDAIASSWVKKGIKTVPEAMETARKSYKDSEARKVKTKLTTKTKFAEAPSWIENTNKRKEVTEEELAELEKEFEEFR